MCYLVPRKFIDSRHVKFNKKIVLKNVYKKTVLETVKELESCGDPEELSNENWFKNLEVTKNIILELKENTNLKVIERITEESSGKWGTPAKRELDKIETEPVSKKKSKQVETTTRKMPMRKPKLNRDCKIQAKSFELPTYIEDLSVYYFKPNILNLKNYAFDLNVENRREKKGLEEDELKFA